jgi:P4 family phage/plasmid primase-like protien
MNEGADFWFNDTGVNPIPSDTQNKKPLILWKNHEDFPLSKETFEQLKRDGKFEQGIAIIPGKIWRGKYKGKYLIAIDIDNGKGLNTFLNRNGKETTIKEFASKTLVEQRRDDTNRAHIYFISPIPFPSKGTDTKIGIEVKGEGSHGLIFVSPSIHKNGHPYEIIGTKNIANLNSKQTIELIRRVDDICIKYDSKYLQKEENSRLTPQIRKMINTLKIDTTIVIPEGERHMTLLSLADSLLISHHNKPVDELKKFFDNINYNLCKPRPLPQNEIDDIWESSIVFVENNREHYINNNNRYDGIQLKKKEKLIEEATEKILSSHHFVTIEESKEILYYNNGVYEKGGNILIEAELETHYEYQLKINDIKEINAHIMRKTYVKFEEFDKDFNIINMKNGLYLINADKLIPHDPNYYSINQKPFPYNPKARRKHFIKFLKEVIYPEDILTVIDILAYTFLRHNPYELYFILVGLGANGKSVLMGVLTELHGRRNVSNVPLSSILNNRFALAGMDGRDVNIDTELSSAIIKDMSILKKLTGQLPIPIERKNQQPYDTILHAKLFFNANAIPPTVDHTDAHYRREIIISFPNQFEEGKNADTKLLSRLTTEEELSGIFNILMKGLRRILKNERI